MPRPKDSLNAATPANLRRVLAYIVECQVEGYTPTRREIATSLRLSQSSVVKCYLPRMIADGAIEIDADNPRRVIVKNAEYRGDNQ